MSETVRFYVDFLLIGKNGELVKNNTYKLKALPVEGHLVHHDNSVYRIDSITHHLTVEDDPYYYTADLTVVAIYKSPKVLAPSRERVTEHPHRKLNLHREPPAEGTLKVPQWLNIDRSQFPPSGRKRPRSTAPLLGLGPQSGSPTHS